jgi:hypothetical protein
MIFPLTRILNEMDVRSIMGESARLHVWDALHSLMPLGLPAANDMPPRTIRE